MPFRIINQDITKIICDAIVNPTDSRFSGGGGTDLAVHTAAGVGLELACRSLKPLSLGEIAVTDGYELPCKYIIHTMEPVWKGGGENEAMFLRSCYINALLKAKSLGAQAIAFPLISSGSFGFPKGMVFKIASDAISDFLFNADSELTISLCVLNHNTFELGFGDALSNFISSLTDFEDFIFSTVCREPLDYCPMSASPYEFNEAKRPETAPQRPTAARLETVPKAKKASVNFSLPCLSDWIKKQDKSFSEMLLELIERKQMSEVQCYKKANVSKNTFSKIKNSGKPVPYQPSKPTVLAFAIALELNMDETQQLLRSAGFSLSRNNLFDMIIEFYITNGVYDIFEINAALYQYDQSCLGC